MSKRSLAIAMVAALAAEVLLAADSQTLKVRDYRSRNERKIVRELVDLLALPNVASDTPNIEKNAAAIVSMLERRGAATKLLRVSGAPPAVYGELKTKGAKRTLILYAHYDGQPVVDAQWAAPPWSPVFMPFPADPARISTVDSVLQADGALDPEGRLYARSASDDKGSIVAMLTAIDALRAARIPLSVNVKFFFDGEEESGSPHLEQILRENAPLLQGDLWIFGDGPVHQSRTMQIFYGVRGVTSLELTAYGPSRSLHSGHYGNWAPNPAAVLANVIASMRDSDGRILIEGFHDDVRPLTDAEKAAIREIPAVDDALRNELALGSTEAANAPLVERIHLPALNLRGLQSGSVGSSASNSIPTTAAASIDFRLVPDQTPESVRAKVEAHLRRLGFQLTSDEPTPEQRRANAKVLRLQWGSGYPATRTSMDHPLAAAVATAVERVSGRLIRLPTLGGSLPIYMFEKALAAPVVGVPIANHDNSQHAANENIRLQNLWDGIEVYASIMAGVGATR